MHHCMNTAWLFGGVDMNRWIAFKAGQPEAVQRLHGARAARSCGLFERPFVSWRNDIALFMGPRQSGYSALDVDDLTAVEVRSHRAMAAHLEYYRAHAPGFEDAYLMLSGAADRRAPCAPAERRGRGAAQPAGRWARPLPDEIGVTPAVSPEVPEHLASPTARWCRRSSTACWPAAATSPATRTRTASCARSRSAGSPGRRPAWRAALAVAQGVAAARRRHRALQSALQAQGVYLRPARAASRRHGARPMPASQPEASVAAEAAESRSDTVSALERGISVLRCFSQERRGARATPTSPSITGIPRPTVNRLVATLAATGMLKPAPGADRFTLGAGRGLAGAACSWPASTCAPSRGRRCRRWPKSCGGSVYLAVRDGMEMVLIEACRPRSSMLVAAPRRRLARAASPVSALGPRLPGGARRARSARS